MGWLDSLFNAESGGVPRGAPSPDRARDLLLYRHDFCGYCVRVDRAIERLGLEVPTANVMSDAAHRAALHKATGRTQVPCLFIDGEPLFESLDIIAWLEAYATRDARLAG